MKLSLQKRLASDVLSCSPSKVKFDNTKLAEIKEAITKVDIRSLIKSGVITKLNDKGISKFRSRITKKQKRKGRQKGQGSRKGSHNARINYKHAWISIVRNQRDLLKYLRSKNLITPKVYQDLYLKSKGGFFRSRRHLHLYIEEHHLISK